MSARMRDLKRVNAVLSEIMRPHATSDSLFARGLSHEGYHGGYQDAIHDVMTAWNGTMPARWERWFAEYPADMTPHHAGRESERKMT